MNQQERSRLLEKLQQGLVQMNLAQTGSRPAAVDAEVAESGFTDDTAQRLIDYVLLLDKWNKTYNLSAIRDPLQMVSRHLLDSLSLLSRVTELKNQASTDEPFRVLDVGTGAGLPGIPLAVCLPEVDFSLLDSNGKKTRFVFQALTALRLNNANVVHSRIENYQSPGQIAIVVSRAFASLADFVRGCEHLCQPRTRLLAMKGTYPDAEIAELPVGWQVVHSEVLDVPGTDGQRHLIELQQQNS